MENNVVKGFKVFNPDWSCRPGGNFKQYTCPGKFEEDIAWLRRGHGIHFCENLADCFEYYRFNPDNKVAEVIAYGEVIKREKQSYTNKLKVVRELTWNEVLHLLNTGENCTGRYNTGDCNTGDYNTGDYNTGDCNTGDYNTGDCNTGKWNTGKWNTGDCNTGKWNTGKWNTGDCNTGDYNTGDWNKSSFNTGCFNTITQKIMLFNKPSDWSYKDWLKSDARYLLNQIPMDVVKWVYESDMTEEEKAEYPTHETMGGYLKILDESECGQIWWDNLSKSERDIIRALPNFDEEIFEQCTGINIKEV